MNNTSMAGSNGSPIVEYPDDRLGPTRDAPECLFYVVHTNHSLACGVVNCGGRTNEEGHWTLNQWKFSLWPTNRLARVAVVGWATSTRGIRAIGANHQRESTGKCSWRPAAKGNRKRCHKGRTVSPSCEDTTIGKYHARSRWATKNKTDNTHSTLHGYAKRKQWGDRIGA